MALEFKNIQIAVSEESKEDLDSVEINEISEEDALIIDRGKKAVRAKRFGRQIAALISEARYDALYGGRFPANKKAQITRKNIVLRNVLKLSPEGEAQHTNIPLLTEHFNKFVSYLSSNPWSLDADTRKNLVHMTTLLGVNREMKGGVING